MYKLGLAQLFSLSTSFRLTPFKFFQGIRYLPGEPEKLSKVEVHHLLLIEQSDRKVNQILGNYYSANWEIMSTCST